MSSNAIISIGSELITVSDMPINQNQRLNLSSFMYSINIQALSVRLQASLLAYLLESSNNLDVGLFYSFKPSVINFQSQ